jgi:processive 1,2-diacylglycerol beta-glucosyltransferase
MTRVLILYGAAHGQGHKSAARALETAFREHDAVSEVRTEDALDYGSSFYRQLYAGFYRELSENLPALWEYVYELADNNDIRFVNELRKLLDRIGVTQLDDLVASFKPDMVICTHFLPLHILGWYKSRGKLNVPLYSIVTDYTGHVYWVHDHVDIYIVATERTRDMLIERGVQPERIKIAGIPVNPAIAEPKDRTQMRQKHQITREPVVMFICSALQPDRVRKIIDGLQNEGTVGTLIVIAGRNPDLEGVLNDVQSTPQLHVRVLFGFIDYLDDLLAASDLVISKAGGLIVSETLARGIPLVLIDPLRGQEEWNADYVVSSGAGVQARVIEMVPGMVQSILADTERLRLLQDRAEQTGDPGIAYTIADMLLSGPTQPEQSG